MSSDTPESTTAGVPKRRVAPLIAKQRQRIGDTHITEFDRTDDDGHKIKKVKRPAVEGGLKEVDVDVTALYSPGISTTSNMEIIRIEAELADEGGEVKNLHVPANDELLDQALDLLDDHDLTPAWEVET